MSNLREKFLSPSGFWDFNLEKISREYDWLKTNNLSNEIIDNLYTDLCLLKEKEEVRYKLNLIMKNWDWWSYELWQVMDNLNHLNDKWIDTSDLESIIMQ